VVAFDDRRNWRRVNDLANDFNASQKDYKVVPTYKGSYDESMTAAIAAFRAGNAPHLLQVFEVGTATMMASQGRHRARGQGDGRRRRQVRPQGLPARGGRLLHRAQGQHAELSLQQLDHGDLHQQGRLQEGRLDTNKPPKTWPEGRAGRGQKLKASGQQVPVHDQLAELDAARELLAWHNVPIATKHNGMGGTGHACLAINSPLHVRHIENLANMAKQGLFTTTAGRTNKGDATVLSGECAMFTAARAPTATSRSNAKFDFGIATLPYYPDVAGAPQNTVIGGASLWVMAGKKPAEYKGVAKLLQLPVQARSADAKSHSARATCRSRRPPST
jgi:sn-glycerol 3-phosphate transport system substrate-binding protein